MSTKKITSALISVYHKDNLDRILKLLKKLDVKIYSTGGTADFIESAGQQVTRVEEITDYPSILGGRVKTLHPKIFGGILGRRNNENDVMQLEEYEIPPIDLVIVDLYPFKETVKSRQDHKDIIEKIDIGGISLIRAAAKNYEDVLIIPSKEHYSFLEKILSAGGNVSEEERKLMAAESFKISSSYDHLICQYLSGEQKALRYGENPHQKAWFNGNLKEVFEQLAGKEISYNNLLDVDAAIGLMAEFKENTFIIIKHNNPCGVATDADAVKCWQKALAGDPVSAFGGIIITNGVVDEKIAAEASNIFFEILIAPDFTADALDLLKQKKNRILLKMKDFSFPGTNERTILNGNLIQERDDFTVSEKDLRTVTEKQPKIKEKLDLIFANKIVKHLKSNAIALVKDFQLIGSGMGQTSRVDSLEQAIGKAKKHNLDLSGAVMASDAFFPFPDCVDIAAKAGITAIIQPGGSMRDQESIDAANSGEIAMVFTGKRHFRH